MPLVRQQQVRVSSACVLLLVAARARKTGWMLSQAKLSHTKRSRLANDYGFASAMSDYMVELDKPVGLTLAPEPSTGKVCVCVCVRGERVREQVRLAPPPPPPPPAPAPLDASSTALLSQPRHAPHNRSSCSKFTRARRQPRAS